MADKFSKEKRSQIMSRIKGKDTKPELLIRSLIHQSGYRYSLHKKDLPGNPDIVFTKRKKVIFIHGCFWHGHKNCRRGSRPATNKKFWDEKISKNITRDKRNYRKLAKLGWQKLVLWECQLIKVEDAYLKIIRFIED